MYFRDVNGNAVNQFNSEDEISVVIRANVNKDMTFPALGFVLKDHNGQKLIAESTDSYLRDQAIVAQSGTEIEAAFKMTSRPSSVANTRWTWHSRKGRAATMSSTTSCTTSSY